tara:strand:+ start:47 stop:634 length:588 start_codon:yes stop_codon:yes gene_type:complete
MLGLGNNNQQPMNNGMLNLGVQTQTQPVPGQFPGMMQQQQFGQQMYQQPAPPSEMEMQILLLRGIVPVDRFIASNQMATLVQLINNVVSLSVLEVMKNAVFIEDEAAGGLKLDITKLPSHLQTMSAENIKAEFATMQGTAQGNIQQAEMTQQQIAQLSQQSAMSGAMQRLMQDESLIDKAGETAGKFMGNFLGTR